MAGRLSGEPGNELAARYIAGWFQRVGLRPVGTSRQRDPRARLDGSGYYQPFTFELGRVKDRRNHLVVRAGGQVLRLKPGRDYEPAPGSASRAVGGEVVFVGCGQSAEAVDDYAGADVQGKVVLALSGIPVADKLARTKYPERKSVSAHEHGALALVLVADNDADSPVSRRATRRAYDVPVVTLRRAVARRMLERAGLSLDALQASALAGPFSKRTGIAVDLETSLRPRMCVTANVVGLLPGSDPALRDQTVVIGAHMDHLGRGIVGTLPDDYSAQVHPGADDNASGTAAILALAEHFATMRERPRRSILFVCFSGEEEGLYGSLHYVAHPFIPLASTEAMLNLDMVGRMQNDRIYLNGAGSSPAWHPLIDELNRSACFNLSYLDSIPDGSDHKPFAERNVPVLFFFSGMHPDYHRPTDTADKINRLDEARTVSLVADVAARLAWEPRRITWHGPSGSPATEPR